MYNNIYIIGVPEGDDKKQGIENLFEEVMVENFPKRVKEKDTKFQKMQSPKNDDPKEVHTKIRHN